jgi:phospholipase/carboxylesterase
MPEDRRGGRAIVFLHGYGGSGRALAPLVRELAEGDTRLFLPTAVLPHASGRGAMWWEFLEEDWPKPYSSDPGANAWPKPSRQLPRAREAVIRLLTRIRERYRPEEVVLAGHSQGAMLALDVAAGLEPPVDAVALVAGYVLLDSVPALSTPRAHRPRVLVSHGRQDTLVGFDRAELAREVLERHGFPVSFRPHDGGHALDPVALRDLRAFLHRELEAF